MTVERNPQDDAWPHIRYFGAFNRKDSRRVRIEPDESLCFVSWTFVLYAVTGASLVDADAVVLVSAPIELAKCR